MAAPDRLENAGIQGYAVRVSQRGTFDEAGQGIGPDGEAGPFVLNLCPVPGTPPRDEHGASR